MVRTRLRILMLLAFVPVIVIIGRLWSLQLDPDAHHSFHIRAEHAKLLRVPPTRGVILDRKGRVLAANRPVFHLHFVYRQLNPRYVVLDVVCAELAKIGDFPSSREVELHLRQTYAEAAEEAAAVGVAVSEELRLIEDIPASVARRIERRLRPRRVYRDGYVLRRESSSVAVSEERFNAELDPSEADDSRYTLFFRPEEVFRFESTLERLAGKVEHKTFEDLDERVVDTLAKIERSVERYVRRDREAGVEDAIWRSKARNARHNSYADSWALVEDVSLDVVTQIEYHPERFPGIEVVDGSERYYPYGASCGMLVGFLGRMTQKQIDMLEDEGHLLDTWTNIRSAEAFEVVREDSLRRFDLVGRAGLERFYDSMLRGEYGMRVVQVDSRMRERAVLESLPAESGTWLRTTIDAELQKLLYEKIDDRVAQLGAIAGSIVVLGVPSGEIVASVGFPSIDPNRLRESKYHEELKNRWSHLKPGPWIDRPVYHAIDPGSVFKIVPAVAALESGSDWEGEVDPLRTYDCVSGDGRAFRMRCASRYGHGELHMYDAFRTSCNNYFYHLSTKHLDVARIREWAHHFGYGRAPGLDLPRRGPGYDAGRLLPENKIAGERGICSLAIGQTYVLATPIQVARSFAAFAAGGEFLPTPWFVERAAPEELPIRGERTAKVIAESLSRVVSEVGGTVYGKSELEEFSFAAKTGSARFQDGSSRSHSWIAGFAPARDPKIAFTIVIEDSPVGGGKSCAPLARELLEWFAADDASYRADSGHGAHGHEESER